MHQIHTARFYYMNLAKIFLVMIVAAAVFTGCHHPGSDINELHISREDSLAELKRNADALVRIDSLKSIIKSGDLVLRTGNDFTSESLRSLNQRDQTYSHCGIASVENGSIVVYHAIGGDFNPDQKIRRDKLEDFADPLTNRGIGLYHFQLKDSLVKEVIRSTRLFYEMGIPFDMSFDLEKSDRMYCAEFVYKTFLLATRNGIRFNISHIGSFRFIGVDDLFLAPGCTLKKRIIYN